MKVSIITVTYNSAETLKETIDSVLCQSYSNLEYIVIDGASKDATIDIVQGYDDKIAKFVSEPDKGLYYAINKGISLASGELIGILHSDDIYADKTVIEKVVGVFDKDKVDAVYGDLVYVDRENLSRVKRIWKSGPYKNGLFLKGWMPPHPSFFVRKSCYYEYGTYDTRFRTSADYELMLRLLHKNKVSVSYLPQVLVKMRVGGQSNISIKNRVKANKEDRLAWKVNGLNPGLLTTIRKPLSKLSQFLKRK